jgi:integrase
MSVLAAVVARRLAAPEWPSLLSIVTARKASVGVLSPPELPGPGGERRAAGELAAKLDAVMQEAWDASARPGLQLYLEELKKDATPIAWTMDTLQRWLLEHQGKAPKTVEDRIRHLRFMEAYQGQPVMLGGTRYQFVVSGLLFWEVRKHSGATEAAIQKDLKCLSAVGKYLGIRRDVWPVSPPRISGTKERIPTPEEVHAVLHADYATNATRSVESAWVRHVLAMHFGLGLRSPKEMWFLRATDYDAESNLLTVTEPKKRHKVRQVYVEPTWLAKSTRRLSLEGWLRWRAKLNPTGMAMFPNPLTGEDFASPEAFKAFLDRRVKQKFPWWHGYLARHWCVYARIIEAGFSDTAYNQVAEWFGHESVDMTRDTYGPSARAFAKSPKYGKDWLSRAFQKPRAASTKSLKLPG